MKRDIEDFIVKNNFLNEKFEEVNYKDFYSEIFPVGSFERKGKFDDEKGNGILTSINGLDSFNFIVTDDHDALEKFIDDNFVVMSPVSYFGKRKTARNSTKLYGFSLDIDGTGIEELKQLIHQVTSEVNPQPTFLVNSGHGVHLYYVFKKPLNLYNNIKEPLKNLKFGLIDRL